MAGRSRDLLLRVLGDSDSAEAAMARTAAEADAMADAAEDAGNRMGKKFDDVSTKAGGFFGKLGNWASNFGLPSAPFEKMGQKFEEAETHGQKFHNVLSAIGGVTLGASVAGVVAFGAEGVHWADQLETAQVSLKTAVKATGESWASAQPHIAAATASMQHLGFNSTDTAQSLSQLITATGSTTRGTQLLSEAADLARFKHISLSEASQMLARVMAGSNRAITQMGLNLDVGTGKLSTIHTATESVQKAQLALKNTEMEVAAGTLKGAQADASLATAHQNLSIAEENLRRDHEAIGKVLDAVAQKTHGAADAYGHTLAGEMDVARATVHNLGTDFGMFLIPKIEGAIHAVAEIIGWFEKHKAAAIALGAIIAGPLAASIAIFAAEMTGKLAGAISQTTSKVLHLGSTFSQARGQTAETGEANDALAGTLSSLDETIASLTESLNVYKLGVDETSKANASLTEAQISTADSAKQVAMALADADAAIEEANATLAEGDAQLAAYDASVTEASASLDALGASGQAAGDEMAAGMETAEAGLMSTGIGAILVGLGIAAMELMQHWRGALTGLKVAWHAIEDAAEDVAHFLAPVWHGIVDVAKVDMELLYDVFVVVPERIISAVESLPGLMIGWMETVWHGIESAAMEGWNLLWETFVTIPSKILSAVGDGFHVLYDWGKDLVMGIVHGIEDAAGAIGSALLAAIKGGLHGIASAIPGASILSHVPGLSWMASGGLVTSPTLAVVGEAGPELVIPLSMLAPYSHQPAPVHLGPGPPAGATFAGPMASAAASGPTIGPVMVNVYGPGNMSVEELAQAVRQALLQYGRSVGSLWSQWA